MKPIQKKDLDRLRRQISRVKGGRMDPGATSLSQTTDETTPPSDNQPYFKQQQPEHYKVEQYLDGQVMENQWGSYFLSERFYPGHERHGNFDVSTLADLPGELLSGISRDQIPPHDPSRWAFLDTETTGLAGGTGTCAFLVGVGTIEDGGFRVRLFFMRDYDEEAAMLAALADFLQWYDVLVTYNGKSYDVPLLETRYRLARKPFPFERMHHLDLLHGARQLWKLRMESCKLTLLEYEILGFIREGDLPGEMIPYYYFEYLRTRQAFRLAPLFHHNVMDIVTLACLTGVVLPAFAAPAEADLHHGQDILGLARWLKRGRANHDANELYRRAIDAGLPDDNLFRAQWERALIEKKQGRRDEMIRICRDLAEVRNEHRIPALEELAKHYEHHEKDLHQALGFTIQALDHEPSDELEHRRDRLQRKLGKQGDTYNLLQSTMTTGS
jgi:hypothetical protein